MHCNVHSFPSPGSPAYILVPAIFPYIAQNKLKLLKKRGMKTMISFMEKPILQLKYNSIYFLSLLRFGVVPFQRN